MKLLKITGLVLVGLILCATLLALWAPLISYGANALLDENRNPRVFGSSCTVYTQVAVAVNATATTTLLAASSSRAWARIQQPINASNTVQLALNGLPLLVNAGLQLTPATTSSAVPLIDFGLNTGFPYTGAVTASTTAGASTVFVTECGY